MRRPFLLLIFLAFAVNAFGQWVSEKSSTGAFPIHKSAIYVDLKEQALVQKSAELFQKDIEAVTGYRPAIVHGLNQKHENLIIIGSFSNSVLLQRLVAGQKIKNQNPGKWEAYQLQNIKLNSNGISNALIIAGEDRRGTAYGVFDLSREIGVSPWYWWADVPVKKSERLFVKAGLNQTNAPKVKYRGIFLNDEAPALSGWSKEKFGGFNHLFYEKVFELVLRLKGNYIWPAMWGNAFYDDDPENIKTADAYGIVVGTSHHEPLMRAHDEWRRYGSGPWDYEKNKDRLQDFWKKGMERAWNEKIVSIGMRGDGDEPMSRETATALLEKIVDDQRVIINKVTGKPASQTPQLWALYKEVQDYYDKGMRVPDDVTLLLCDDNWGNIRKLPKLTDPARKGGYGIYYHFDYVGGPRNYKWLNTNQFPRIWEQMHLAYEYGVKDIWIVNVGDLKPMEAPISFFLDYAWNPEAIGPDDVQPYILKWAAEQFGSKHAAEIARIIGLYSKYNSRRKPELLDDGTYSLTNYHEWERVFNEYQDLWLEANVLKEQIPSASRDAYFQLVLHPVMACANLYKMYYYTTLNKEAYNNKYTQANAYADSVKAAYGMDSVITRQYHEINGGKWNHMMSQTHIGYTYWQQPEKQKMPAVNYIDTGGAGTLKTGKNESATSSLNNADISRERAGYIAIEADHFSSSHGSKGVSWKILPDLGRTGNAVTSWPVNSSSIPLSVTSPYLTYTFKTSQPGEIKIQGYFSPTLNFLHNPDGLQFAISVDDDKPQIISLNKEDNTEVWNKWAAENIIIKTTNHTISKAGEHTLKYWMIDPGIVLQKLVVDLGGLKPSYLGAEETNGK
ncbi:glycosyhydrolase [Pedobacter sp. HMF7647]|uniref:Glycosyhydrolase n=1 Tax=Hufsiella arboris TaxID=2695275 RepID=A0A7K1YCL2_9SPHI|nr:glycosyl hydrolase 115 family protein [Hufsiella arboris]MXV51839.1 glycosyhydrolase [Hufsiella arboris]